MIAKNYNSTNCNYAKGNDDTSDLNTLNDLRYKILNRILISHLNINFLRNKFEILVSSIPVNLDILMISETKLDESFPVVIEKHINESGKVVDIYLQKYDHFLLISDFNMEISERSMHDFCNAYNLDITSI